MIPALVRYYGGTAREWQATPWGEARPFLSAIPRLLALEFVGAPAPRLPEMPQLDLRKIMEDTSSAIAAATTPARPRTERKTLSEMGIGT